jgi:TolA-binding protein
MSNQDDAWNEEIKDLLLEVSAEDSPPNEARTRILERVEASLAQPDASTGGQEAAAKSSLSAWTTLAFAVAGITAVLVASEPEDEPTPVVTRHSTTAPANPSAANVPPRVEGDSPIPQPTKAPTPTATPGIKVVPVHAIAAASLPESDTIAPKLKSLPKKTLETPDGPKTDLRAEQALLEKARVAIESGRLNRAWKHLRAHTRRFPKGVLVEEREGLWVHGLVRSGRKNRAAKRAKRFLKRFPRSSQRRMVEKALID